MFAAGAGRRIVVLPGVRQRKQEKLLRWTLYVVGLLLLLAVSLLVLGPRSGGP